jgi:hypothetical protein
MMRMVMIVVACLLMAAGAATAKELVNVDKTGLALEGHDPVAFFTEGKAVEAPAFGGFCAYGAAQGYAAPVEIRTWQIFEGRLLLNYDPKVKSLFDADREGYLRKADDNWPSIVEKKGKE